MNCQTLVINTKLILAKRALPLKRLSLTSLALALHLTDGMPGIPVLKSTFFGNARFYSTILCPEVD